MKSLIGMNKFKELKFGMDNNDKNSKIKKNAADYSFLQFQEKIKKNNFLSKKENYEKVFNWILYNFFLIFKSCFY